MFVDLQDCPQNLACLEARFSRQRVANVQQLGKRQGDYLVKVGPVLARLEAVDLAYGQQALHAGEDRGNVASIQQLDGYVEEVGPLGGEVVGKDLLQGGDELQAHWRGRRDENRHKAVAEGRLLILGDGPRQAVLISWRPPLGDAILQVDNSWARVSTLLARGAGACSLDRRTALSCSCSRRLSRPSVNPGFSSA